MPNLQARRTKIIELPEQAYFDNVKSQVATMLRLYQGIMVTPEIIDMYLEIIGTTPPSKVTIRKWLAELGCTAIARGIYKVPWLHHAEVK